MTTIAKLTLEQFLAMPDTKPASEYVDGEVIQKPMPDQKRSRLQTFLARILDEFLEITGLGVVGTEWRCIFGPPGHERPYVPDLMVIRRERQTSGRHFHGPQTSRSRSSRPTSRPVSSPTRFCSTYSTGFG